MAIQPVSSAPPLKLESVVLDCMVTKPGAQGDRSTAFSMKQGYELTVSGSFLTIASKLGKRIVHVTHITEGVPCE